MEEDKTADGMGQKSSGLGIEKLRERSESLESLESLRSLKS